MAGELLLDTGALVSLLDRSQPQHQPCAVGFQAWTGPVVSTEAVLTETTHLLGRVHRGRETCLDFVLRGGVVIVPSTRKSLARCRTLIETYADLRPVHARRAVRVALASGSTLGPFRIVGLLGRGSMASTATDYSRRRPPAPDGRGRAVSRLCDVPEPSPVEAAEGDTPSTKTPTPGSRLSLGSGPAGSGARSACPRIQTLRAERGVDASASYLHRDSAAARALTSGAGGRRIPDGL